MSLHFVAVAWSRVALSLQCRCILLPLLGPVLLCHCSVAAFCGRCLVPFCCVTAVSLHFVAVAWFRFALSLQCRGILLQLVVLVLLFHRSVAASCCYSLLPFCYDTTVSLHFLL